MRVTPAPDSHVTYPHALLSRLASSVPREGCARDRVTAGSQEGDDDGRNDVEDPELGGPRSRGLERQEVGSVDLDRGERDAARVDEGGEAGPGPQQDKDRGHDLADVHAVTQDHRYAVLCEILHHVAG